MNDGDESHCSADTDKDTTSILAQNLDDRSNDYQVAYLLEGGGVQFHVTL